MRLVVDTLIAVMLIAVLGGLVLRQRSEQSMLDRIGLVQQSIRAIESQALYRAAVGDAEGTPRGFAKAMEPQWFARVPQNELLPDHAIRLWIDRVADDEPHRLNPPQIVAEGPVASFWYNPERGIVRARVPEQMSQQATADLYNLVNGTSLRVDDVDWTSPRPAQVADEADRSRDARSAASPGAARTAASSKAKKTPNLPVVAPPSGVKAKPDEPAEQANGDGAVRDLLAPRQ